MRRLCASGIPMQSFPPFLQTLQTPSGQKIAPVPLLFSLLAWSIRHFASRAAAEAVKNVDQGRNSMRYLRFFVALRRTNCHYFAADLKSPDCLTVAGSGQLFP